MSNRTVYQQIASTLDAMARCETMGNTEWQHRHRETIKRIVSDLPRGSGIDSGVSFDWDRSTPQKLVFNTAFHHMNDGGYYDGWTEHSLIVTPCLSFGMSLRITGRDRNQIKDYLHDVFRHALTAEYVHPVAAVAD